ncbi:MAG: 4Fe-4S binding protein [Spirochaetales bacterium]|nr:4Fe-4S binding protein [Spirochaetales bacterium]
MQKSTTQKIIRYTILVSILLLTVILGRLHSYIKLFPAIDAFCPFGGLESLFTVIRYDAFLKRIALSSMILFGAVVLTALLFRRSFCGNICPLGFLQEISARIGMKILGKRFYLPSRLDRIMRFIKFLVLVVVLGGTWLTLSLIFRPMDPWAAFHHIGSEELFSSYFIGFIILIASLIGSFFLDRVFCKYVCPMGAFLAPVSKIGLYSIKNDREKCTSCGKCDSVCSMNVSISDSEVIKSGECISCMECFAVCPEAALSVTPLKSRDRKLKPSLLIFFTLLIFVVVIGITTVTKQFVWKAPTGLPPRTERLLWGPQRLKGDNTFEDVVTIFRINPAFIMQEWEISEEDFTLPLSELQKDPDSVQEFIEELYEEAGLDPRKIYAGGACGGH